MLDDIRQREILKRKLEQNTKNEDQKFNEKIINKAKSLLSIKAAFKNRWNKKVQEIRVSEQINEREIMGRTQTARNKADNIPIKGTLKEPLILKLLSCDLDNIEMGDLLNLTNCLKEIKDDDSLKTGNVQNPNVTCLICKTNFTNKAQHTLHLKKPNNEKWKNTTKKKRSLSNSAIIMNAIL